MTAQTLAAAVAAEVFARGALEAHDKEQAARRLELVQRHAEAKLRVVQFSAGLNVAKIELAHRVLYLDGSYAGGGSERASVVSDMVDWLGTGVKRTYYDPSTGYFGTKNYDAWRGQRSDHEYNCGPRHGNICFAVGLKAEHRFRVGNTVEVRLTDEEREAALYYLLNIERIEAAAAQVAA